MQENGARMTSRHIVSGVLWAVLIATIVGSSQPAHAATDSVVLVWNETTVEAIRRSTIGPPAVARALAIVHTSIYDVWAAFDPIAAGVHYRATSTGDATDERRSRAISYAAYRALVNLFPTQLPLFADTMASLGFDPTDVSHPDSNLGAIAAQAGSISGRLTEQTNAEDMPTTPGTRRSTRPRS
jgi:hypothetical protein